MDRWESQGSFNELGLRKGLTRAFMAVDKLYGFYIGRDIWHTVVSLAIDFFFIRF